MKNNQWKSKMRGGHRKNAGRPKGSANRRTLEWRDLGRTLMTRGTARAQKIMDKSSDEMFMQYFLKLAEYFQSKAKTDHAVTIDFGLTPEEQRAIQAIPADRMKEFLKTIIEFNNSSHGRRTEDES